MRTVEQNRSELIADLVEAVAPFESDYIRGVIDAINERAEEKGLRKPALELRLAGESEPAAAG